MYFVVIFAIFMTSLFAPLIAQLLMDDGSLLARQRAAQQFLWIDETVWFPLLLTFLCLITHSVFVSHRIAGPLVRLRRVLGAVDAVADPCARQRRPVHQSRTHDEHPAAERVPATIQTGLLARCRRTHRSRGHLQRTAHQSGRLHLLRGR
ncbi:MAG: hypothetical protein ABGY72_21800 [bacterium]